MKDRPVLDGRGTVGILLALAGLLLLLQNLNLIGILGPLSWAIFFWVGALIFWSRYQRDPTNQWRLIPALALATIGTVIALDHLIPGVEVGGMIALGVVSTGFWTYFSRNRQHWWAIIPAGVTGSLAIQSVFGELTPWLPTGGIFFYGLAATFGLVFLWGQPKPQVAWALIPAGVLAVIGTIVTLSTAMHLLLPIGLILLGVYQLRKSKGNRE